MNERILMSGGLRRMGGMILAWIVAVVALVTFAPGSEAQSANVAAFEAETMQYGSFARVIKANSVPSGQALRWDSTGAAAQQVNLKNPGGAIVVQARTTAGSGVVPTMRVLLDGQQAESFSTVSSGTFTTYRVVKDISAGSHTVAIEGIIPGSKKLVVDVVYIQASDTGPPPPPPPPPPPSNDCPGSLQARIDAAPSGGTVQADPCIYREQIEIDKPLTLVGAEGTEIRGSEAWSDKAWSASGNNWVSAQVLPNFHQEDASCERGFPTRCAWPEQVFVDGAPLTQVESGADPDAGEFKVDAERHVVLGSDPAGKLVEVTERKHLITGTISADNVTIRNVDGKHAATDWRCGAVQSHEPSTGSGASFDSCRNGAGSGDGDNWNLYDSEISHAHGALLSLRGENANIEGNHLHHGGELGIHNPGDGSVVRENEVSYNNTEHFCIRPSTDYCQVHPTDGDQNFNPDPLTESGGMKIAGGKGNILVSANDFHHNYGNGIWCDVGCHDMTISNNRTHDNARRGIFFEISYGADIFGNVVYRNGFGTPEGLNGAGLEVGTSDGANVHDNVLAWNADGLLAKCSSGRDNATCENNFIHDNTILQRPNGNDSWPGLALMWSGQTSFFDAASNNRGSGNDYYYGGSEDAQQRFAWGSKYSSLASFNATLGEEGGRYLTEAEKQALVEARTLPASP